MSKSYNDCLSTRIRCGNSTAAEDALADAAPDLLAACEAAVTEYDLAKRAGFEPRMMVCLERTARLARAAIAKATTH